MSRQQLKLNHNPKHRGASNSTPRRASCKRNRRFFAALASAGAEPAEYDVARPPQVRLRRRHASREVAAVDDLALK
jgi:hypothetical protein